LYLNEGLTLFLLRVTEKQCILYNTHTFVSSYWSYTENMKPITVTLRVIFPCHPLPYRVSESVGDVRLSHATCTIQLFHIVGNEFFLASEYRFLAVVADIWTNHRLHALLPRSLSLSCHLPSAVNEATSSFRVPSGLQTTAFYVSCSYRVHSMCPAHFMLAPSPKSSQYLPSLQLPSSILPIFICLVCILQ